MPLTYHIAHVNRVLQDYLHPAFYPSTWIFNSFVLAKNAVHTADIGSRCRYALFPEQISYLGTCLALKSHAVHALNYRSMFIGNKLVLVLR